VSDVPSSKRAVTHLPMLVQGARQQRGNNLGETWVITRCNGVFSVPEQEIDEDRSTCLECLAYVESPQN
jgi:hypothetical protein